LGVAEIATEAPDTEELDTAGSGEISAQAGETAVTLSAIAINRPKMRREVLIVRHWATERREYQFIKFCRMKWFKWVEQRAALNQGVI
jgi:hypothetical protein